MKKVKLLSLICLIAISLLSLTACFTSTEEYTEWRLDGTSLSDGTKTYTLYGTTEYWQSSDNYVYYYINTLDLEDGGYANLSHPIGREDIILAEFYTEHEYGYNYDRTNVYFLDTGRGALDAIWGGVDMSYASLVDRDSSMMTLADVELKAMLNALGATARDLTEFSYVELNNMQRLDLVSYSLEGFLAHNHGAFFFDYGSVYYLHLEGKPESTLHGGMLADGQEKYHLVKLTPEEAAVLDRSRASLDYYFKKTEWEEPSYITDDGKDTRHTGALAVLLVIVAAVGIILPLLPLIYTIVISVKRSRKPDVLDWVTIAASGVWLISGIVVFIVLLC